MIRKRISLAQNFFKNRALIALIVEKSSLNKNDVVYEIGPGEGIITKKLATKAGKVIAIEKDANLVQKLKAELRNESNVQIIENDILQYKIKDKDYKIFSNMPFNLTAELVKGIIFGENPPREAYLFIQKEAAGKFTGIPRETEVSVLAKPWFLFEILREFKKTDFEPVPNVDVVFLHIKRRDNPLLPTEGAWKFKKFVHFGFNAWKKDLQTAYKKVFTYEQWKRLSKNLCFSTKATPTELNFEQWLGLFNYFLIGVIEQKKAKILET